VRIRLTISAPTTPEFRIHQHKKVCLHDTVVYLEILNCFYQGFFVPGLYEELDVEFTPQQWRYHQDVIRIRSSAGETITIPLHGYPTMNDILFPKNLDFGNCALAER
jgi:hypothetical protein